MGKTKSRGRSKGLSKGRSKGLSKGRSKGRGRSGITHVKKKTVTRHRATTSASVDSMVVITGGKVAREENAIGKVAKVLAINRAKSKYGVRLNHNGKVMILFPENLRKATESEKDADPVLHDRDGLSFIEEYERAYS